MIDLIQTIGSGILVGFIYALLGLCIVIIYRASEAFNFAIGQFLVIGSYLFYTMFVAFNLPLPIALPLGLLAAGAMGAIIERLTIKPLLGRDPMLMTKVTLGLYFFLSAFINFALKYTGSPGWQPLGLPDIKLDTGGFLFLSEQIWAGILSLLTFGLVMVALFRTRWGLAVRALSENQARAMAFGINARFIILMIWGISSACIAVAGIMISNFGILSTSSALVGFRAIPVVIIGGINSIAGALIAGIIIGIFETLVAAYIEPMGLLGFKDVATYILMLIVLFIRPYGLFGTVRIERV
ncbi:MAG: branched-chain amino acid ABC transporter permease [Deltaproteobacteria bacterium]|nr:branched-chain amino acid ABC transporter permease [Deltaproteobacteria bacterium]